MQKKEHRPSSERGHVWSTNPSKIAASGTSNDEASQDYHVISFAGCMTEEACCGALLKRAISFMEYLGFWHAMRVSISQLDAIILLEGTPFYWPEKEQRL